MDYKEICNTFQKHIVEDYFTANIKSEVTLDTLLTPVIADILTIVGTKKLEAETDPKFGAALEVKGTMKLIAKEFPMKKVGEQSYRNCNADYLMYDNGEEGTLYFVELKTARDSFDVAQMKNYIKYIMEHRGKSFGEIAGENFIALLNHVSETGCSHKYDNKEYPEKAPWRKKNGKDCLKSLFDHIIRYKKGFEWNEGDAHTEIAKGYLKHWKAFSSKKYLLTAGQMLDHMKYGKWWDCKKMRLIYIMPEELSEEQKSKYKDLIKEEKLVFVTFKDIEKNCKEMNSEYWTRLTEILKGCGLFST